MIYRLLELTLETLLIAFIALRLILVMVAHTYTLDIPVDVVMLVILIFREYQIFKDEV